MHVFTVSLSGVTTTLEYMGSYKLMSLGVDEIDDALKSADALSEIGFAPSQADLLDLVCARRAAVGKRLVEYGRTTSMRKREFADAKSVNSFEALQNRWITTAVVLCSRALYFFWCG
jgi:hypothetical protein